MKFAIKIHGRQNFYHPDLKGSKNDIFFCFDLGIYSWTEDSASPSKDFDHDADVLILAFVRGSDRGKIF